MSRPSAFSTIRRGLDFTPEFRPVIRWLVMAGVLLGLGRVAVPVLFQQIFDKGLLAEDGIDSDLVLRYALITVAVVIGVNAMSIVVNIALARLAEAALAGLRGTVLRRAVDLSMTEHAVERQGDLVSRTTGDIEQLTRFLDWGAYAWLFDMSIAITALIAMFVYSPALALAGFLSLLLMVPVLIWIQRRELRQITEWRERTSDLLSDTNEAIAGADVVRGFGQQEATTARLNRGVGRVYRSQLSINKYGCVLFPVSDAFGTIASAAIIVTAVALGADGPGLGTTIAVLFLLQIILNPIAEITEVIDQTSMALAGWERVIDLASREQAIPDPAHPVPIRQGPLDAQLSDVTFAYGEQPVVRDVDVFVAAGTSVAIVGATGSGKTTLARLLCRLADPDEGSVRLGGVDLRELSRADRRKAVRMVPQDGFLFATTIADNVARGRTGATEADIDAAVAQLGLGPWVAGLPDGLQTELGPGGEGLSVGERQLVALIRAALADPGLLILDEATSSLDPATELAMTEALDHLKVGRTTITVAHRLSTAERADRVVVMDAGLIVEQGTHTELVATAGVYASLHEAWSRGVGATGSTGD